MAARLGLNLSHLAVRPPGRAGARLPIFGERGAEMRGIRLIECRDGACDGIAGRKDRRSRPTVRLSELEGITHSVAAPPGAPAGRPHGKVALPSPCRSWRMVTRWSRRRFAPSVL